MFHDVLHLLYVTVGACSTETKSTWCCDIECSFCAWYIISLGWTVNQYIQLKIWILLLLSVHIWETILCRYNQAVSDRSMLTSVWSCWSKRPCSWRWPSVSCSSSSGPSSKACRLTLTNLTKRHFNSETRMMHSNSRNRLNHRDKATVQKCSIYFHTFQNCLTLGRVFHA